jgi:uncharacterized membrane protein
MLLLNLLPVIASWSYSNFLRKDLTLRLKNVQMLVLINFAVHIVLAGYLIYLIKTKNKDMENFTANFKKMPRKVYAKLIFVMLLTMYASYSYYNLIKNNNINYVIPVLRGGRQILIVIIGYFFYKENVTFYSLIGLIFIIIGICIM